MKIEPFPGTVTLQWVRVPRATKSGRTAYASVRKYAIDDEQLAWLRRWFPKIENERVAQAIGIDRRAVNRLAHELHLKKSKAGMAAIRKRTAKAIKRICQRNGYYDSLRGRMPKECVEAHAKMWQDIHEGRRLHPIKIMQRDRPQEYQKAMAAKGKTRRELFRKERLRDKYGLERQTNLRIVERRYTRRQVNHRYNALKRGYIVMQDSSDRGGERYNIYYDRDTRRSAQFEENLQRDGFTVKRYDNEENGTDQHTA